MIGAVIGDIIGSIYEWKNTKSEEFQLFTTESCFTDDTVLTIAVANSFLDDNITFEQSLLNWAKKYPNAGYGARFKKWVHLKKQKPYNSWGNGSAMRVSPVAYVATSIDEVLSFAEKTAEVTHNHPEGITGAQAIASAVFLAHRNKSKIEIKNFIEEKFEYNLNRKINDIRKNYKFYVRCSKSVPEAIIAFIESEDYLSTIKKAISIGGDSDTIACMAGAIAQAYYKVIPKEVFSKAKTYLPFEFIEIINRFEHKYSVKYKII